MPNAKLFPPEDLVHDLTMSLWRDRAALHDLARRKAWEPSIDDCRRLAERQVEQLKSHGVLEVTRQVAVPIACRPHAPARAMGLPVWRAAPRRASDRCAAAIPTF